MGKTEQHHRVGDDMEEFRQRKSPPEIELDCLAD
jgi:hypothetical protein